MLHPAPPRAGSVWMMQLHRLVRDSLESGSML